MAHLRHGYRTHFDMVSLGTPPNLYDGLSDNIGPRASEWAGAMANEMMEPIARDREDVVPNPDE